MIELIVSHCEFYSEKYRWDNCSCHCLDCSSSRNKGFSQIKCYFIVLECVQLDNVYWRVFVNKLQSPYIYANRIGGVHRGATESFIAIAYVPLQRVGNTNLAYDVSADLIELGRTPIAVVCAGAKSILVDWCYVF